MHNRLAQERFPFRGCFLGFLLLFGPQVANRAAEFSTRAAASGVRGTVRNERGDPVSGIELEGGATKTTTDAAGGYFLAEPAGPILVRQTEGGRRDYILESALVTVSDGAVTTRNLAAVQVSATLSGFVKDDSGKAVAGLKIHAETLYGPTYARDVVSGLDGSFSVDLSAAYWLIRPDDLELEAKGYAPIAPA